MKILKISAVIALTSSSINADTLQNRADENWRTESILSGTPISVMSYGIKRLDEDLNDLASNEWYFKQFKQDGEIGLLQAFNSVKIIEDTVSPVILIRPQYGNLASDRIEAKQAQKICAKNCLTRHHKLWASLSMTIMTTFLGYGLILSFLRIILI